MLSSTALMMKNYKHLLKFLSLFICCLIPENESIFYFYLTQIFVQIKIDF